MTITGTSDHTDRLKRMQDVNADVVRALYVAGQAIELEAERSITNGSISGKGHVPSSPGQPPNADTRLLDSSIETEVVNASIPTVTVTSYAPYSSALEYGTSRMAERPFMRPAVAKKRDDVTRMVGEAVSITTR